MSAGFVKEGHGQDRGHGGRGRELGEWRFCFSAILHYLVNFRLPPQVDADGNPVEGQEELAKIILQQQQLQVERKQPAEKRGIK